MMMHEEMLDGRDERDAYRLAVGQELQDDNRSGIFLCFSIIFFILKYFHVTFSCF